MNNKLLALNMIVAGGEAALLERCLKHACVKGAFDEIIIVNTSDDSEIDKVARAYKADVYKYEWSTPAYPHGNFAGARNEALKNTTCDYFMWLDTDDIICETWPLQVVNLRKYLAQNLYDFYPMEYQLFYDAKGNATTKFKRERIIKRRADIYWTMPVHEQLSINPNIHKGIEMAGMHIKHKPIKTSQDGAVRNLQIIKHERSVNPSPHIDYYCARELWNNNQFDESAKMFEEFLDKREGAQDDFAVACIKISQHNLYKDKDENGVQAFKEDTIGKAETFARLSFGFSENYAEPLVYLGDIYSIKGNDRKAIEFYKLALQPREKGSGIKDLKFSSHVPAFRLAQLYFLKKEYENSLLYTKLIIRDDPKNKFIKNLRKQIITALINEEEKTNG